MTAQLSQFRSRFAAAGLDEGIISQSALRQCLVEEIGPYRERIYSPLKTLSLFLAQVLNADHSCQQVVAEHMVEHLKSHGRPCSLNNGSYCEARKRLASSFLERLCREIGQGLAAQQPAHWLWQGRHVKLVDGTTVSMPDTPANQESFPQNREQRAGLGFPLAMLVGVVSLSCGAVLDWKSGPCIGKQTGETALLWALSPHFERGDIMVADRCYAGYFMIARMVTMGVDVVVRQNATRHTDFGSGLGLGKGDHLVTWQRPQRPRWMDSATFRSMPKTLTIREVQCGNWILSTTLTNHQEVPKSAVQTLYHWRWNIELDFRAIKDVMQMGVLRCKNPNMVAKEIAAHLIAYNLVRALMARAARWGDVAPRLLRFKTTLQTLRAWQSTAGPSDDGMTSSDTGALLTAIAHLKLTSRPGRIEPRVRKRRPKPSKLMTRPRSELRSQILEERNTWTQPFP